VDVIVDAGESTELVYATSLYSVAPVIPVENATDKVVEDVAVALEIAVVPGMVNTDAVLDTADVPLELMA
jgi:hypothetical protein